MTRAVEAGRAILVLKRLVECLTEALFAHVQTGGQPGRLEIGAQHVLELRTEDATTDDLQCDLLRRARGRVWCRPPAPRW